MNRKKLFWGFLILLLFIACGRRNAVKHVSQFTLPEVVPATGITTPENSVGLPVTKTATNLTIIPAGKPVVVLNLTNTHKASKPKLIEVHLSPLNNSQPVVINIRDTHATLAGFPQIVLARNAGFKDNDPENFSSFKSLQGLSQPLIRCMMQDREGNIWFGTYSGGVSKYDGKYFTNYTIAQGLSNDGVWSLIQDQEGNIWMGTLGGGIIKFDGISFTNYKTSDGLCDNNVYALCEDEKGNIWIGTNKGISCFNGKSFTNYFTGPGLPDQMIHCIKKDRQGNLWFGTNEGALVFSNESFKALAGGICKTGPSMPFSWINRMQSGWGQTIN
jgi:hypothetical protein